MSRLWVSGYRSYELGVFKEVDKRLDIIKYALKKELIMQIEQGVTWIITGPQLGVEQWSIEIVLELKKEYDIKIALIAPYDNFQKNWQEEKQAKFLKLKTTVDYYATVSKKDYENPRQLKNWQDFMLSHTDASLLVYDVEREGKPIYDFNKITYFRQNHDYGLQLISFDDLQQYAIEYGEEEKNDKNY